MLTAAQVFLATVHKMKAKKLASTSENGPAEVCSVPGDLPKHQHQHQVLHRHGCFRLNCGVHRLLKVWMPLVMVLSQVDGY
jgi:hypothetical protein